MVPTLEITLKLRCHNLPGTHAGERTAVRLGIQKRQEVIDDVSADAEEAIFTVPVRVEFKPTGVANFLGPFVHGTPRERFVYLCWGERIGELWEGVSRAKLQLLPLPHTLLFHAADNDVPLEVSINMTDEKGKHLCATIKESQLSWNM